MIPENMIYLLFIFIGCLIRAIAPFIRKFLAGEIPEGWENKYTIILLVSYVVAIIATAFVYQANPFDITWTMEVAATNGLILGVTANWIIDEVVKWFFPSE